MIVVGIYEITKNYGQYFDGRVDMPVPADIPLIIMNSGIVFLGFTSIGFGIHGIVTGKTIPDSVMNAASFIRPPRDQRPQGGRRR